MSILNSVPLSGFLSGAATGAPSISALSMSTAMTPIAFNFASDPTGTKRFGIDTAAVTTLAATQGKYNCILNGGGITVTDLVTLNHQALREISNRQVIPLILTIPSSGSLTLDLTSYGFTVKPTVILAPEEVLPGNNTNAVIGSCSATSLTVKMYRSQSILILGGNPALATGGTCHVILVSNG